MELENEPLEIMEEKKPDLPFSKVLELLMNKVESGRPIPTGQTLPPWRIPSASICEEWTKINMILAKSMEIQSSRVPGSEDFDSFIISNSCLAIAGLLKYYIESLNLADNLKVVFGVLLWDANARDGPDDYEGTPHVWLDIKDCPIDNTYVALPEESELHLEYFYNAKKANYYVKTDPLTTKLNLYVGSKETIDTTRHNLKVFRTYVTDDDTKGDMVEKYLVFALECIGLNPSVKMYDLLMRKYLKGEFGVEVQDLVVKWAKKCWFCPSIQDVAAAAPKVEDLKTCTECKMAKYCGKECQKADWKAHKLLHKELILTQQVLSEQSEEQSISLHRL